MHIDKSTQYTIVFVLGVYCMKGLEAGLCEHLIIHLLDIGVYIENSRPMKHKAKTTLCHGLINEIY